MLFRSISILTNGTLLNQDIVDKLKTLNNLRYLQISLDGGTKEVHDVIRGKGNFEKSINSIKLLKKNSLKVSSKFTVHKKNLFDLKNYLDLTEYLKLNFVSVARFIPWGQSKDVINLFLSPSEIKSVYELVKEFAEKNDGKIVYDTRRPLWNLIENGNHKLGGRCLAGYNGLTIMPNGNVLPCRAMGKSLGMY